MRKYFTDAYKVKFSARVLREETLIDGRHGLILDETFFYPTSGGQPNDLGTIAGVRVTDVIDGDDIIHIMEKPLDLAEVECELDWPRRFDHMQQHSGQHILSACFEKLYNGSTVGFHLGNDYVTIDVTLDELTVEMAEKVEEAANTLIYRNLPIKAYFVEPKELSTLPLRKLPAVNENIRIVEVAGEDYSPCGGTHPKSTGEIGIIKIRGWEKKRDNIRVEFLCGRRALQDYRWKNEQINQIANQLSLRDFEVLEGFNRLNADTKELRRELSYLKGILQVYEAQELYNNTQQINGVRVVSRIFTGKDLSEIKLLANKICEKEKVIVLFALKGEKAQVIFSRSGDVNINMSELLKEVVGLIKGTGGGNPKSAQGGGSDLNSLECLMQSAEKIITGRHLT